MQGQRTFKVSSLDTNQFLLNSLAESDSGLARHVLLEEMLLHSLHGIVEVLLCQGLATDDVPEEAADGIDS